MSDRTSDRLTDILARVQTLPDESQELIVAELEERVSELSSSRLNPAQRTEVQHRLSASREHVTDGVIGEILQRYRSGT